MDIEMMTPMQVSKVLMLSRSKTYGLLASGELSSVKIGRSRRVPRRMLDDFIDRLCAQV
jgi:excisionase family DNA binding protein